MSQNGNGRHCFSFAQFRLYPEERLLVRGSERVGVTPRVLDLLLVLVNHHGELVKKEELLASVWPDSFVEEGNINRTVSTLRKSLGSQANGSDFIETVPKLGYRFIAPVEEGIDEPEPELLQIPWSTVRRPVFWATAVAGVLVVVLFASSYVTGPSSKDTEDRSADRAGQNVPAPGSTEPVRLTHDPGRHAYPIWTDDGRIRYQHYGRYKNGAPYIMDSNGENQTPVNDIPGVRQGVWSPNGKRLFFWKHDDPAVYLADADGKNEKKLPFNGGNFSWSSDGTHIVYVSVVVRGKTNDWEIFTYDLATEKTVNVTNNLAFDADPAFSPDGSEIVFNSNRDGNFEIYLMNSDGGNIRQLTDHPAWDSHPVFSTDGTQIIFNSNREKENYDIYLMNSDGGRVTKLTNWDSNEAIEPGCWSSDGTKIALLSDRFGNDDIYVMNVEAFRPQLLVADENANVSAAVYSPDGREIAYQAELPDKSGELRIRDIESGQVRSLLKTENGNLRPAWSADGRRIAFQNKVTGETSLFSINVDGNDLTKLTNDPMTETVPSWSPDGKKVAYVASNYGRARLYTIDHKTSEQLPLTPREGWEGDPVWSPDGKKIAFSCDRLDTPGNGLDICLMEADGSNERRLLSRRGHDSQPAWSRDGSRLAFVANSDGNHEIYLINSDGTGLLRLTRDPGVDSDPHWSPDGTTITFTSNRSGKYAVYQIAL